MTDLNQNGAETPDQMEARVRGRIAEIDTQIGEAREQKKALGVRISELNAEKEQWQRMLPRAPRQRRAADPNQATLTG